MTNVSSEELSNLLPKASYGVGWLIVGSGLLASSLLLGDDVTSCMKPSGLRIDFCFGLVGIGMGIGATVMAIKFNKLREEIRVYGKNNN